MKIFFSEYKSDYSNYIFPYAIWAFPEDGDTPSKIFDSGFLPSTYNLDRYYMCRHVRIKLADFEASSENRRILRKGAGITQELVSREEFAITNERLEFCKKYADTKFGIDKMSTNKLKSLFSSPVCSHVLVFFDEALSNEIGYIVLFLDESKTAFYYYAFYNLDYPNKSLGMYMMTSTVAFVRQKEFRHIYLGSCYSKNALYKTQFAGFEFWNGFRWSENLSELKYLISRDSQPIYKHLLETREFLELFYQGGLIK